MCRRRVRRLSRRWPDIHGDGFRENLRLSLVRCWARRDLRLDIASRIAVLIDQVEYLVRKLESERDGLLLPRRHRYVRDFRQLRGIRNCRETRGGAELLREEREDRRAGSRRSGRLAVGGHRHRSFQLPGSSWLGGLDREPLAGCAYLHCGPECRTGDGSTCRGQYSRGDEDARRPVAPSAETPSSRDWPIWPLLRHTTRPPFASGGVQRGYLSRLGVGKALKANSLQTLTLRFFRNRPACRPPCRRCHPRSTQQRPL